MGFARWYDQAIVPKLVRIGCSDPRIVDLRRNVVPLAEGRVFELGVGVQQACAQGLVHLGVN